jgi:hypothetical protein
MPNWKKIVTSGSNASLNQITASAALFTGGVDFDDNNLSNVGSISAGSNTIRGKVPFIQNTNAEVLKNDEIEGFVPFSNVNIIDRKVTTGYWRFVVPFAGYVKDIRLHPHQGATAGSVTLGIRKNGSQLSSDVSATVSATAGTVTDFNFGTNHSFAAGDYINIFIDREAALRSRGFGLTITYMITT